MPSAGGGLTLPIRSVVPPPSSSTSSSSSVRSASVSSSSRTTPHHRVSTSCTRAKSRTPAVAATPSDDGDVDDVDYDDDDDDDVTIVAKPAKKSRSTSIAAAFTRRGSSPMEKIRRILSRSSKSSDLAATTTAATASTVARPICCETSVQTDDIEDVQKAELKRQLLETNQELEKVREKLKQSALQRQEKTIDEFACGDATPRLVASSQQRVALSPLSGNQHNASADESPDIIILDDENHWDTIRHLRVRLAEAENRLKEERVEHRAIYRDFVTIVRVAERRREEAQASLDSLRSSTDADDDDWALLMAENRNGLRRNALLTWAQSRIEPYGVRVNNFSLDWSNGQAYCALLHSFFPNLVGDDPTAGDCAARALHAMEKLGTCGSQLEVGQPSPNWRHVMNAVFVVYKRAVLDK